MAALKHYIVVRESFLGEGAGATLVAAGSRVNSEQLGRTQPGSNLAEVDENGRPVNDDEARKLAEMGLDNVPAQVAAVQPHAPNPTRPQAIPPRPLGSQPLVERDQRYQPSQGVESDEAKAARIAHLKEELAMLEAQAEAVEEARQVGPAPELEPEPRRGREEAEPGPLDMSIPDLTTHLDTIDDPAELDRLRTAETGGKSRSGALAAIDARKAALAG